MILYRPSRQADADLDDIADYVAADDPRAAIGILDALRVAFRTLAASPDIGSLRDDLMPHLRMFSPKRPASNYIVLLLRAPDRCDRRNSAGTVDSGRASTPPRVLSIAAHTCLVIRNEQNSWFTSGCGVQCFEATVPLTGPTGSHCVTRSKTKTQSCGEGTFSWKSTARPSCRQLWRWP